MSHVREGLPKADGARSCRSFSPHSRSPLPLTSIHSPSRSSLRLPPPVAFAFPPPHVHLHTPPLRVQPSPRSPAQSFPALEPPRILHQQTPPRRNAAGCSHYHQARLSPDHYYHASPVAEESDEGIAAGRMGPRGCAPEGVERASWLEAARGLDGQEDGSALCNRTRSRRAGCAEARVSGQASATRIDLDSSSKRRSGAHCVSWYQKRFQPFLPPTTASTAAPAASLDVGSAGYRQRRPLKPD